jgi:hypothetical protein
MADSNNIPQEAEQLAEALNSQDNDTRKEAKSEVANTDFEKEYSIAQQNNNGAGTQSSDPTSVNREPAAAGTGKSESSTGSSTGGAATYSLDDSDPSDYLAMAREIGQSEEAVSE